MPADFYPVTIEGLDPARPKRPRFFAASYEDIRAYRPLHGASFRLRLLEPAPYHTRQSALEAAKLYEFFYLLEDPSRRLGKPCGLEQLIARREGAAPIPKALLRAAKGAHP